MIPKDADVDTGFRKRSCSTIRSTAAACDGERQFILFVLKISPARCFLPNRRLGLIRRWGPGETQGENVHEDFDRCRFLRNFGPRRRTGDAGRAGAVRRSRPRRSRRAAGPAWRATPPAAAVRPSWRAPALPACVATRSAAAARAKQRFTERNKRRRKSGAVFLCSSRHCVFRRRRSPRLSQPGSRHHGAPGRVSQPTDVPCKLYSNDKAYRAELGASFSLLGGIGTWLEKRSSCSRTAPATAPPSFSRATSGASTRRST